MRETGTVLLRGRPLRAGEKRLASQRGQALVELAVERFGAVDGVVQVAAYDTFMGGLDDTGDDDWRDVLGTNVTGTMHVVSAASAAMGDRGGSIVFTGQDDYPADLFLDQVRLTPH